MYICLIIKHLKFKWFKGYFVRDHPFLKGLFFFFLSLSLGMWDLSCMTRDWTHDPCIGNSEPLFICFFIEGQLLYSIALEKLEVLITGPRGKSLTLPSWNSFFCFSLLLRSAKCSLPFKLDMSYGWGGRIQGKSFPSWCDSLSLSRPGLVSQVPCFRFKFKLLLFS